MDKESKAHTRTIEGMAWERPKPSEIEIDPGERRDPGHESFPFCKEGADNLGRHSRMVFDSISDAVSVIDARTFKILDANRAFLDQYHLGRDEVIERTCHRITHHQSRPCMPPLDPCPLHETVKNGTPTTVDHVHLEKDGGKVYVEITTFPMFDEEGKVTSVVHISRDITERKKAEEERGRLIAQLEITQAELKQLFDEVPCYISVQDKELGLTEVNRKFKEDFGDAQGSHCYETYKQRRTRCFPCPVQDSFDTGESHSSEEIVTTRKGEQLHVLVRTAPIRNGKGEITRVIEMSTDITEIRNLQDRLSSLGLMIGSMSHGVKGLLTGLDGGMYQLDTGFRKGDRARIATGMELVKLMVSRIRKMILDILYYAKERGLNCELFEVVEFADDLFITVEPKAREYGVEFVADVVGYLGEFVIDVVLLRTAMINILENALDACREDKAKDRHKVVFRAARNQGLVTFTVYDNGMGMDAETKNKMFTLFFSSKGSKGTGLGLFIANDIVRLHGGSIHVESMPGKGSLFKVTLPERPPYKTKCIEIKDSKEYPQSSNASS